MCRTDSLRKYITAMQGVVDNLSTEKVYTFCVWGASQFADCIHWKVWGGLPRFWLDFNQLCGAPPLIIAMYDLNVAAEEKDQRHLVSRKEYFFRTAMWSELHPPDRKLL